jgi:ribonuclease BN (tRNA processing enzyme)
MASGIEVYVVGDSSLFTSLGKGVGYLVRADGAQYMIDCGATPFLALGFEGIKNVRGLFATHSHEDHRRWFTDLVLYMHYHPLIENRLSLMTSEAIHEEYEKNSKGALERSLSADSRTVVDVPYSEFVDKVTIGPRAKYRVEHLPSGEGRVWRVIEVASGDVVSPDRAKVFVNPRANRPRMLFKDPGNGLWVEPETYYPFSSTVFYEEDRNDLVDRETGLTFRAVKAAAWHGPPTIGILVTLGDDKVAFSSDTVYDPALWQELVDERHPISKELKKKGFAQAQVLHDDINKYIEQSWSQERYDEAMTCYDGAVVIHDADFERSVVHTAQSNFRPDTDWRRLILTHTPDGFASIYPITVTGKRYRVFNGDVYESVNGKDWPLDADLYFKDNNGLLWVGYKNDDGPACLWETNKGLVVDSGPEKGLGGADRGECLGQYDLYVDVSGRYVPAPGGERESYRLRPDGRAELVTETDTGSSGVVVENVRGSITRKR